MRTANNRVRLSKGAGALYYQVALDLRERIFSDEFSTGDIFPTEQELCEEYSVSRITVRQAMAILENEGIVSRQQGRGTYVRDWNPESLGWYYGYVDELIVLAKETRLELFSKKLTKAPYHVCRDMRLSKGEKIYYFKGIRHVLKKYRASYSAYVPIKFGKDIDIHRSESATLFTSIEKLSHEVAQRAYQNIYATVATRKLSREIQVPVGHPLLVTKRIYFSGRDEAMLMAITHFPGDLYHSTAVLERKVR